MIRRRVTAVAAWATIVLVLLGVPALLVGLCGDPLPTMTQLLTMLRWEPDWNDSILLGKLLPCTAWIAWAIFAFPLIAELAHSRTQRRVLPTVRILRAQQHLAGFLVATALLGNNTATGGLLTHSRPATVAMDTESLDIPIVPGPVSATRDRVEAAPRRVGTSAHGDLYRVRSGDTLWDIADRRLGSGADYPKIVHASTGIAQPDGQHLTDPDLILPGWRFDIPTKRAAATPTPPTTPAAQTPGTRANSTPMPGGQASSPVRETPTPEAARSQSAVRGDDASRTVDDEAVAIGRVAIPGGVAALLAAGLLGTLARRRRTQRSSRRWGERIPVPDSGPAADFETQLQAISDPEALHDLHRALAEVYRIVQESARSLPDLFAARIDEVEIALYLDIPARLGDPFQPLFEDDTVWTVPRAALPFDRSTRLPDPYPALVTVGTDLDGGILLLDLEHQTVLSIAATDGASATPFLNAIVAELASTPWGEDIHLSLVGVPEHLAIELDPYRIHRVTDVPTLCRDLRVHLHDRRGALDAAGIPDVRTARLAAGDGEAWAPFVVIIGTPPIAGEREEIEALVQQFGSAGLAILQTASGSVASALIDLTPTGASYRTVTSGVPALPFDPQLLHDHALEAALQVFAVQPTTQPHRGNRTVNNDLPDAVQPHSETVEEAGAPTGGQVGSAGSGYGSNATEKQITTANRDRDRDAVPDHRVPSAPYLRLLGQIELTNVQCPDLLPGRGAELLAYLLHHQPVLGTQIQKALWPTTYDRTNNNARTLAKQVRAALGSDPGGHLWLPEGHGSSGFTVHPGISSDWRDFETGVGLDPTTASTEQLATALTLVRGQPLLGSDGYRGRWAWRAPLEETIIASVLDASEVLAARALQTNDAALIRLAVRAARLIDPLGEVSWRIELLAAHRRHNIADVERIILDLHATAGRGNPDYLPDALTADLITRIRHDLSQIRT